MAPPNTKKRICHDVVNRLRTSVGEYLVGDDWEEALIGRHFKNLQGSPMIATAIEVPYGGTDEGWFMLKQGGGGFNATILVSIETFKKEDVQDAVAKVELAMRAIPLSVVVRRFPLERCHAWLREQGCALAA